MGGAGFLALAIAAGALPSLLAFPPIAAAWMAGQGIMHFLIGRFFNDRASQLVGANLSGPVVQLQVAVTMLLAVLTMAEPFTGLQLIGAVLMLAGSFATRKTISEKGFADPGRSPRARSPAARLPSRPAISRATFSAHARPLRMESRRSWCALHSPTLRRPA